VGDDGDTRTRSPLPELVEDEHKLFKIAVVDGHTTEAEEKGIGIAV
jgi:hypothetical protein